jgi:hypothetical protein
MSKNGDRNYVSFWFWFFAILIMALPCIGPIMILVWAFVGENESRKNYFRALLAWCLLFFLLWAGILAFGFWPEIQKLVADWLPRSK